MLKKFLWQYKFVFLLFFIFAAIFTMVCWLYGAALEAVLYSLLLCAVVGLIFFSVFFYRYVRKNGEMKRLLDNYDIMPLPKPQDETEKVFYEIIEKLRAKNKADFEERKEERTEFTDYYGMWIHQIKTPIAAMQLTLQEEDTENNRLLLNELFRIEQYAEMALWYLRMDDGSDLVLKRYDIDEIIKDAVRKYAPLFIKKKLKLNYRPVSVEVLTDKKWLSFIIEQLLDNAVKYTEKGEITVGTEGKVLKISDTGIGIAEDDLPRIFEKGYTGFNGRIERKSTGIGLYLCAKAAKKLSHKLTVFSEEGKGTTFCIDMNNDFTATE